MNKKQPVRRPKPRGATASNLPTEAEGAREVCVTHTKETQEVFAGPIPDPQTLASYEAIQAGFANRIMNMAELEQAHRHEREKDALDGTIQDRQAERKAERRGQYLAFGAVLSILSLSAYMVYCGAPAAGTTLGATTLVGCAGIFIARQYYDNKEEKPPIPKDDNE